MQDRDDGAFILNNASFMAKEKLHLRLIGRRNLAGVQKERISTVLTASKNTVNYLSSKTYRLF